MALHHIGDPLGGVGPAELPRCGLHRPRAPASANSAPSVASRRSASQSSSGTNMAAPLRTSAWRWPAGGLGGTGQRHEHGGYATSVSSATVIARPADHDVGGGVEQRHALS